MSGSERALLYRVGLETERRANEIKTLTTGRCSLYSNPPTLIVKAGYIKRRKERIHPIPVDLAEALSEYIPTERVYSVIDFLDLRSYEFPYFIKPRYIYIPVVMRVFHINCGCPE